MALPPRQLTSVYYKPVLPPPPRTPPPRNNNSSETLTGDMFFDNDKDSMAIYIYLGTSTLDAENNVYIDITKDISIPGYNEHGHMPKPIVIENNGNFFTYDPDKNIVPKKEKIILPLKKIINPIDYTLNGNAVPGKDYITITRIAKVYRDDKKNETFFDSLGKRLNIVIQNYIIKSNMYQIKGTSMKTPYLCKMLEKLTRSGCPGAQNGSAKTRRQQQRRRRANSRRLR